jgi:hypothetical protein
MIVPYFLPAGGPRQRGYLSEDYSFCERARRVGVVPFADTRIKLGHVGRYTYTWDDLFPRERHESFALTIEDPGFPAAVTDRRQDEDTLYAKIGRQARAPGAARRGAYDEPSAGAGGVVSGEVHPGRVLVNLTEQSWRWCPRGSGRPRRRRSTGCPPWWWRADEHAGAGAA